MANFGDTGHSSWEGVDHAKKVALLTRLVLDVATSNLDTNQPIIGVSS